LDDGLSVPRKEILELESRSGVSLAAIFKIKKSKKKKLV
jgi:hypothetical protein